MEEALRYMLFTLLKLFDMVSEAWISIVLIRCTDSDASVDEEWRWLIGRLSSCPRCIITFFIGQCCCFSIFLVSSKPIRDQRRPITFRNKSWRLIRLPMWRWKGSSVVRWSSFFLSLLVYFSGSTKKLVKFRTKPVTPLGTFRTANVILVHQNPRFYLGRLD